MILKAAISSLLLAIEKQFTAHSKGGWWFDYSLNSL